MINQLINTTIYEMFKIYKNKLNFKNCTINNKINLTFTRGIKGKIQILT